MLLHAVCSCRNLCILFYQELQPYNIFLRISFESLHPNNHLMVGMYFTKSTTSIRGTVNPKWWSFLRRLEQSGTAITFVIRCLNHIACHYIIIFKHQQMWCNITGIISPCEKNPSTSVTRATFKENKQNWLESGCQGPQWRWIGLDDILTPLGWGNKRRHTAEKAKKIHFLCFCNSELIFHCISSHSIYCTCIYVFFLNWPLN